MLAAGLAAPERPASTTVRAHATFSTVTQPSQRHETLCLLSFLSQASRVLADTRDQLGIPWQYSERLLSFLSQGSRVLVDARDKLGIPWQYSENEKHGMFLMAFENKAGLPVDPATFQLYVPALSALWGDSGIREAFSRIGGRRETLVSLAFCRGP